MRLFLIVWQFEDIDRECEWTHVVLEEYPDPNKIEQIIEDFMRDNHEEEREDYDISDYWCNTIDTVNGYKISVNKL